MVFNYSYPEIYNVIAILNNKNYANNYYAKINIYYILLYLLRKILRLLNYQPFIIAIFELFSNEKGN